MIKQTEALKLALEALAPFANDADGIHQDWASERRRASLTQERPLTVGDFRRAKGAHTALREALAEQPAQQGYWEEQPDGSMIPVDPSEMQPAQPQQEPVAKDWRHVIPGRRYTDQWDSARVADYNQGWNDCQKKTKAELDKLYTSPPASNQCKFPLCQNEDYQQALAEQIKQELYTGEPAQRKPLTPEWYAQWIRNNYQDYWNIATLCDEMTKAAHGIKEKNT